MRVGILNAIAPDKSRVNWGGSPIDAYIRFLKSVDAPFSFSGYEAAQRELPPSPAACDAYVITGSPSGAYESEPWIGELADFIRASFAQGKKLVGICFGHQILAHALGGRAEKADGGWGLGLRSFAIHTAKAWMPDVAESCSLYFAHQDQVVELPPGAELLGGSEFCPNAMYAVGDQVLALQGHPEFTETIMRQIIDDARGKLVGATYEEAARSVDRGQPDAQLAARWIVNFLAY